MNTNKKIKMMRFIGMLLIAAILLTMPVFAGVNYAEKGGRVVLEYLFWFALIGGIIVVGKYVLDANLAKALISFVAACFVIYLIGAPDSLKTVSNNLFSSVFGS